MESLQSKMRKVTRIVVIGAIAIFVFTVAPLLLSALLAKHGVTLGDFGTVGELNAVWFYFLFFYVLMTN